MTVLERAEQTLREAGEPLRAEEITRRMLASGHWQTTGSTPEATVNARLAVDIKRKGRNSLFQRTDQKVFALREWGLPVYAPLRRIDWRARRREKKRGTVVKEPMEP